MSVKGRPGNERTPLRPRAKGDPVSLIRRELVQVRPARAGERDRIAAWNLQLIRDEGNGSDPSLAEIDGRLREWLAADYRASVFEVGGVPFGYAIHRELADCTHLRHFFVEAAFRRRGLGRQAFACLRRDVFPADRRILVEALVANSAAIAFWESVGFVQRYVGLQIAPAAQRQ